MVNLSEIKIVLLKEEHKTILKDFKSYERELVDFLLEDACNNHKIGISKTYLLIHQNKVVAYVTILVDALRLEGDLRDFFKDKGVYYKTLPALKIGRLAVHDDYLRQGLGTFTLAFVRKIFESVTEKAGCRFLIVDAKRNKNPKLNAIHFYKKLGFKPLKEREKGTIPMYLDLLFDEDMS